MTIKKKILSFIMLNVLCLTTITSLYFNTSVCANSLTDYGSIFSTFTQLVGANEDVPINVLDSLVFDAICPRDAGFISRVSGRLNYELTKKCIAKYLNNKYSNQDKTKDNITQSDINEFSQDLSQNISYTDQSTTYNNNSKSMVNLCINEFITDSGTYYRYSLELTGNASIFPSTEAYQAFKQLVTEHQAGYIITWQKSYNRALLIPLAGNKCVYYGQSGNNTTAIYVYNASNATQLRGQVYNYDSTNKYYKDAGYAEDAQIILQNAGSGTSWNEYYFYGNRMCFTYGGVQRYLIYNSVSNMQDYVVGEQPFYYNNVVNNNWNNSTGDYTVTTDNSNHATYSDVQTYIDDHHTETGTYPDPTEINVYIENVPAPTPDPEPTPEPTPTPDNPSGGGSGSSVSGNSGGNASATATAQGGSSSANNEGINITINNNHNINLGGGSGLSGNTVSGNGSGSSGGIGGIFDFLSQIGDFLGSLIKNIGNVLADIVTGIGSVVSSLLEVIPTVFNDFLGGVLGWLPPELRALVTLSISAMIIVGLIKLFRG